MVATIYVPSKGRAGRSSTAEKLLEQGIDFILAVPAGERLEYDRAYPDVDILVTPPGIGPTREAIRRFAIAEGQRWHWQIDDDITNFYERQDDVQVRQGNWKPALVGMQDVAMRHPSVTLAGPQFRQFAWQGPDWIYNVSIRNALLIRDDADGAFWQYVKEDLDFALQLLHHGQDTIRFNRWSMSSPQMGTSAGGCAEDYEAGALSASSKLLMARWGQGYMTLSEDRRGYLANRVKWSRFRREVPMLSST